MIVLNDDNVQNMLILVHKCSLSKHGRVEALLVPLHTREARPVGLDTSKIEKQTHGDMAGVIKHAL